MKKATLIALACCVLASAKAQQAKQAADTTQPQTLYLIADKGVFESLVNMLTYPSRVSNVDREQMVAILQRQTKPMPKKEEQPAVKKK